MKLQGFTQGRKRLAPSIILAAVVLLAAWMGDTSGGYFTGDWASVVFLLVALLLVVSLTGAFGVIRSRWSVVALCLFGGYAAWTGASILWSPNRGDAWLGTGLTLLYLLVFLTAVVLLASGASRRWVLAASVLGPAALAALTLAALAPGLEAFFENSRLVGTVGYYNGEAAFLLLPFWVAIYLAGSRSTNTVVRGLALGGGALSVQVAVLTQSRGALVAMTVSLLIFFALSGQRLRGFLALVPVAVALLVSFPELNGVYLAFLNEEDPAGALERAVPTVLLTSALVGAFGLCWGLLDRLWSPPASLVRIFGGVVLVALVVVSVAGAVAAGERVGSPIAWTAQKWEAFKSNNAAGEEQSRYLSASGSGRYVLWEVAVKDFASDPLLGVGTHNYEATYYRLREQQVGYARQPHSLPLEVLGERGVVGGALFFGFLTTCLTVGLSKRFGQLNAEGKALTGAATAAVAYWFVHSSAEWFWQIPAVTLPAIVYLAVLVAPWRRTDEQAARPGWPLRLTVAAAAVLVAFAVTPLYLSDRLLTRSNTAVSPQEALAAIESAQRFNALDARLPQREAELAAQIGDRARAADSYAEARRLNPDHYAPYALLAAFHEQAGDTSLARTFYEEALARNPLDPDLGRRAEELER